MYKLIVLVFVGLLAYVKSQEVCSAEGAVCGTIRGLQCCANQQMRCHLDGDYPDAAGKCVKTCKRAGEMCGGFAGIQCCSGEGLRCDAPKQCCDMAGKCVA